MHIIRLIFARECKVRIRKRSYILMSILGPLLLAAIVIIPLFLQKIEKQTIKQVAIIDESYILGETIKDFENYRFTIIQDTTVEDFRKQYQASGYDAVLFIPKNIYSSNTCILYSHVWIDNALKAYVGYVLRRDLEYMALLKEQVTIETIKRVSTPVFVGVQKWTKEGEYIDEEVSMTKKSNIAIIAAIIIYIFIFMYGVMVLRAVLEEKTGRVVEILVSSVKPFQLMAGKILGIGTIGLLQFIVWIGLTYSIVYGAQVMLFPETYNPTPLPELQESLENTSQGLLQLQSNSHIDYAVNVFQALDGVNWIVMLSSFVFFFIFGYLLYAALFAAIGAMVDQDSETQQFVIPATIPLMLSIFLLGYIVTNPSGNLAVWLSFIPFTSPIAMMARLPFGVPYWHIVISALTLIITCIVMVWISAKLYKTGILMYGKKMSFKTIRSVITSK
ncbi:MAG TPA: ABC transporter permease [Bacteroidales bacterium]|nr:ABC transporter permease [Bacteroidales bacterium]